MAHLITVSGERIELARNRSYTIGRGRECDVVVQDMSSSRRHAKIIVAAGRHALFLEDLGSRNGTFLNGERVRERTRLNDSDRIRIGTSVLMLRTEEHPPDETDPELLDSGTVAFETLMLGDRADEGILRVVKKRGAGSSDFAGQLASFSVVEVLQLLTQTHRSGQLNFALPSGSAVVELRMGEVHSAEIGEVRGFPALIELGKQRNGLFWLVETNEPCERNVRESPARLLVELCRAIDENVSGMASRGRAGPA